MSIGCVPASGWQRIVGQPFLMSGLFVFGFNGEKQLQSTSIWFRHGVTRPTNIARAISSDCGVGYVGMHVVIQAPDSAVALSSPSCMLCCALAAVLI